MKISKLDIIYTLLFGMLLLVISSCRHRQKEIQLAGKTKEKHAAARPASPSRPAVGKTGETGFSQKLSLSHKEIKENRLYAFADEWYGVPYRYGGCDKKGVDCSCFTNLLYQQVYRKNISRSAAEIFSSCDKISVEDAKEGDLLFFKIGGNSISHVGVYIRRSYFIHSSTSKGVILNSLEEAYYKKYFFCAGKIRNV